MQILQRGSIIKIYFSGTVQTLGCFAVILDMDIKQCQQLLCPDKMGIQTDYFPKLDNSQVLIASFGCCQSRIILFNGLIGGV